MEEMRILKRDENNNQQRINDLNRKISKAIKKYIRRYKNEKKSYKALKRIRT